MKKVLSVLLSAAMLLTVVSGLNLTALADNDVVGTVSVSVAGQLSLGTNTVNVSTDSENSYYKFAPTETAFYELAKDMAFDGYFELYDENLNYLGYINDSIFYQLKSDEVYYLLAISYDDDTKADITLKISDIASVSFTTGDNAVLVQDDDSYRETDENGNVIEYYYSLHNAVYAEGNVITVTKNDGTKTDYVCSINDGWGFYSSDGEPLDTSHAYKLEIDYNSPYQFAVGKNDCSIKICGAEVPITFTVMENPVASFAFIGTIIADNSADNSEIYTDDNNEKFRYYYPDFSEGSKLVVNYKDGTSEAYTYTKIDEDKYYNFINENGELFKYGYVGLYDSQYDEHWTIGSSNYVTIEYMGYEVQAPVTVNCVSHSYVGATCTLCGAANPNYVATTNPVTPSASSGLTTDSTTAPVVNNTGSTMNTTSSTDKKPKKPTIKKLTKGKKKITVQWKKVSGVKGYQVQVATDKKFKKNKKTVTIKKSGSTKTTVKKLKSNKKYYVRVRTYKVVNGKKVYSKWSTVKTVKTK